MSIELNHTIIQTNNKAESVRFYTEMFGFKYSGDLGPFAPIEIPGQSLKLDFLDDRKNFERLHFAFKVSDTTFDEIFEKIVERKLTYGSEP
jgi:catechol 2,3-dioxygenase-like lactoylglutathione lyase family enzyme